MYRNFGRSWMSSGSVAIDTSERRAEQQVLRDLFDHVEAARLARVHGEHRDDLAGELRTDLVEVLALHQDTVPEELCCLTAFGIREFRGIHLLHDPPPPPHPPPLPPPPPPP